MKESLSRNLLISTVAIAAPLALLLTFGVAAEEEPQPPLPRNIPGLTAEDRFPNGCVDCHINMPDLQQDERLSTLMAGWSKAVEAPLLEKVQAVAPKGVTLKGIHPTVTASMQDIPGACIACHRKVARIAPPLAALVLTIHLTGGSDNHFLTIFQGECTHCHKLDVTTGVWTMSTAPEK